jgi:phosphatidylinositol-3-phosphatase
LRELLRPIDRAIAAAATLTGRRFGMLVASSLVATSAIVAAAITNPADNGPLAALLGRSLASNTTPAPASPAPAPEPPQSSSPARGSLAPPTGQSRGGGGPESSAPITGPEAVGPEGQPGAPATPSTPSSPSQKAGRIKHVFVISLASPGNEAAFGAASQMPYLASTLRPQGELLSGYSLLESAGLPNEIAAISGQPPNPSTAADCSTYAEFPSTTTTNKEGIVSGSGCVYPVETLTVADQLSSAGFQWRAYAEGMTGEGGKAESCVHPDAGAAEQPTQGGYAARQNPFVYFHSLLDLGACTSSDVPLTELDNDLSTITATPNYSFIAPDLCDAGVEGQCPSGAPSGAASADAFLSQWVPQILASPAYKQDGLLIISFDEASTGAAPTSTPPPVGALLLSRYVTPGSTDSTPYNPYSLLRSTEDLFGIRHLAAAEGSAVSSFAPALLGETGGD